MMESLIDLSIGKRSADMLRPYQRENAQRIAQGESILLCHEVGAGKSATTAHGVAWGLEQGLVVLVSTGTIVRGVWGAELDAWVDTARIQYSAAVGTPAQRQAIVQAALASSGLRILGVTFDTAHDLLELLQGAQIDVLVIDEISLARNPASRRFRALIQLAARARQRIGLTGSPTPNSIMDIFGVVGLVDLGKSLGTSIGTFRQNFMVKTGPKAWQVAEKSTARAQVLDRIKHMVSVVRTVDVVEGMPSLTRTVVDVELPESVLRQYREVESGLLGEDELHQDAILIKCQQFANGRVKGVDGQLLEVHDVKLRAAVDLIDVLLEAGEQVLVAYAFKADAAALMAHYPMQSMLFESTRTEQCLKAWNEGQPIMLLHPKCLHPSTEVLTEHRGWQRIVDVRADERVFDGVEYVTHGGCRNSGVREVIDLFGLTMTPDHKLLIEGVWLEAKDVLDSGITAARAVWRPQTGLGTVSPLRQTAGDQGRQPAQVRAGGQVKVRALPTGSQPQDAAHLAKDAVTGDRPKSQRLSSLWRGWARCSRRLAQLRELLRRHGRLVSGRPDAGADRQLEGVQQRELPLGNPHGAAAQQVKQSVSDLPRAEAASGRTGEDHRAEQDRVDLQAGPGDDCRGGRAGCSEQSVRAKHGPAMHSEPKRSQVFDLIDCGPRHRFVIRNSAGDVFISHNSAGHGLNLQRAPRGGHLIWLSATWSSELYEQTVGRIFRPGQRRPVRVALISAVGTIDEVVLRVLDRKVDAQLLVKAYLAERRAQSGGNSASVDLAAQIKLARQEVSRSHPDHGGTEERFRQAWAKLQMLLGKSV
jgi:hypothetical protein